MKKYLRSAVFISYLILVIISTSCKTNLLTMNVKEPAPVYLPASIKTVGIIDRTMPTVANEPLDMVEKILTAEGKDLDKEGANKAVLGLNDELIKTKLFTKVMIIDKANLRSPGVGVFPSPLSWESIDLLCKENNVDAIFELSFFDTDAKVEYQVVPVEVVGPLGLKATVYEHHATITTLIKTGWRIYDPINKLIRDEFLIKEVVKSKGVGINPMKAIEAILNRKESVMQVSTIIGQDYASRIVPFYIKVSRDYYVKGTDNFKIAKRRAVTGDWDGAAELWYKEINNPEMKIAGRAHYNMAIINEINGDLNAALEWANKAYIDYNNKLALRYTNILKDRIEKKKRLEND